MNLLLKISVIPALILSLASCGGISDSKGASFDPINFLKGNLNGYRVIRDRNMNVKLAADVIRTCRSVGELKGECEDEIHYGENKVSRETFQYEISYGENLIQHLSMKGDRGSLEGAMHGTGLFMTGVLAVPGEKSKTQAETRWDGLSGNNDRISIQRDSYYYHGILFTGSVETVWQR